MKIDLLKYLVVIIRSSQKFVHVIFFTKFSSHLNFKSIATEIMVPLIQIFRFSIQKRPFSHKLPTNNYCYWHIVSQLGNKKHEKKNNAPARLEP